MPNNLFHPYICVDCGHTSFHPEHSSGCSFATFTLFAFLGLVWWFNNALITVILIVVVLLIISEIFYHYCSKHKCPECGYTEIVPIFSPRGQRILKEHDYGP